MRGYLFGGTQRIKESWRFFGGTHRLRKAHVLTERVGCTLEGFGLARALPRVAPETMRAVPAFANSPVVLRYFLVPGPYMGPFRHEKQKGLLVGGRTLLEGGSIVSATSCAFEKGWSGHFGPVALRRRRARRRKSRRHRVLQSPRGSRAWDPERIMSGP